MRTWPDAMLEWGEGGAERENRAEIRRIPAIFAAARVESGLRSRTAPRSGSRRHNAGRSAHIPHSSALSRRRHRSPHRRRSQAPRSDTGRPRPSARLPEFGKARMARWPPVMRGCRADPKALPYRCFPLRARRRPPAPKAAGRTRAHTPPHRRRKAPPRSSPG